MRHVNMLGEGLGGGPFPTRGPLKQQMLDGQDVLFPDENWKEEKIVDEWKIQHMFEFDNGYKLSAIRGPHTYGGPSKWEIAPMDNSREFIGQALLDWSDDVLGHLSLTEVHKYCTMVSKL